MADLILGPLVDVTISKVISVTTEQLNLAVGFKQEHKRFRVVLSMVKGVLQDAEQKKVTGHFDLQPWLKELGNIVDEADNVVDEITYEHLRYKVAQKQLWKKVGYFFSLSNPLAFRLKIANRIKDLNLDLASLNDWATGLGLQHRLANKLPEHLEIQQTDSSLGDPSIIVGRENQALEVIKSLIEIDSSNDQPVCVVSIVGMGGIGKTTMAKLVCNNELIQRHFFTITWVCVSENFDVKQILVEMLKTVIAKDDSHVDLPSQDSVVKKLREKLEEKAKKEKLERTNSELQEKQEELEGKNYLLILDDVWNEDRQKWENLRRCLLGIGKNVKGTVLVTTRSQNVATIMGTLSEHKLHLEKLVDDDCWSIIKRRAFGNSLFPAELEGIGMDIAKKCRGVALVANVIGGIVFNNRRKDDWLSIKDNSEVWGTIEEVNGVFHMLQLSFNRLPTSALKQCFAFCSIFPKNFVMEKEMLIQLWMAEGFLQPFSERYLEMEDIGDEYFNALFSYSLFQNATRDSYGIIIACKMHDLIHDLAQFVSKSQTLILEDGSGSDIPIDIRHLNLISDEGMTTAKLRDALKKLHTLFSRVVVFHNMPADIRKLRVLSFYGANIDELPAFLGKLKRLRYLDVSETRIKELPKFITKLHHLQTFRFMDCYYLKRPLQGIWDLVSLRHIYFNDEKHMPAGIGRLTCLKTLQLFVVARRKGHQIEELGSLSQLRGKLEIRNLNMVRNKAEAKGARLFEKAAIQELELVFGLEFNAIDEDSKHDEDVLEGLQPNSNLKGLTIKHYCGERCPSWMLKSVNLMSERVNFLINLVSIKFYKCPWLESIPSLLHKNEANVEIKNCKYLESIADSSYQKLIIEECDKLFSVEVGPLAMKSLKEVHIERCRKLENLPMISELQSLEILELEECVSLRMIGDNARFASTCLKELNIRSCDSLMSMPGVDGLSFLQKIHIWCGQLKSIGESLSSSTCLKEFRIWACGGLMSLPSLHGLSSLQKIYISNCKELKSIGESLCSSTCLKELTIFDCNGLKSLPSLHGLSSLQTLCIEGCFGLTSLPSGLLSCTALEKLTIARCYNLISIPDDLRSIPKSACLAHLKNLEIGGFSTKLNGFLDLSFIRGSLVNLIAWGKPRERLLDQIQHQTTLRKLTIKDFNGMEALPNWFGNLSSLQTLFISRCKSLKHMEAIQCLSKLNSLEILDCPELEERCTRGTGSEWHYISHIPYINIDRRWIQRERAPVKH